MANLTPEVRINKHGVPVVKHVNSTGKANTTSMPIPAPAAPGTVAKGTPLILPDPADAKFVAAALNFKGRNAAKEYLGRINSTGMGIIQRFIEPEPERANVVRRFVFITQSLHPTEDEMTNALLILEHALTTDRDDISLLLSEDTFAVFANAAIGLRTDEITQGEAVPIIGTTEQLAGDTAVATFVAKYGDDLDTKAEEHPILNYPTVHRGKWDEVLPTIRNPHLDLLLREQPEDHERIYEFLRERVNDHTDVGPVDALLDYLTESKDNPALRDGWL